MEKTKVELWITPDQEYRWTKDAAALKITLFEYIRRTVDAYSTIVHQHDNQKYEKVLTEDL